MFYHEIYKYRESQNMRTKRQCDLFRHPQYLALLIKADISKNSLFEILNVLTSFE